MYKRTTKLQIISEFRSDQTAAISAGSSKLGSLESTAPPCSIAISCSEYPIHVNLPPWPPFLGDPLIPVADFRSFLASGDDFPFALLLFPVLFILVLGD